MQPRPLTRVYPHVLILPRRYWKSGRHDSPAVFDMFFRKAPFAGEYTVFAGLDEVLKFIQTFHFKPEHIAYLRTQLKHCDEGFWDYLTALDCSEVKVYAVAEGTVGEWQPRKLAERCYALYIHAS
jgi:nicotinic acid phosphoribosyltransferase